MALREIDARTGTTAARPHRRTLAGRRHALGPRPATVTELRPVPRTEVLALARREKRRWLALACLVFVTPFLCCMGVLGVVR